MKKYKSKIDAFLYVKDMGQDLDYDITKDVSVEYEVIINEREWGWDGFRIKATNLSPVHVDIYDAEDFEVKDAWDIKLDLNKLKIDIIKKGNNLYCDGLSLYLTPEGDIIYEDTELTFITP